MTVKNSMAGLHDIDSDDLERMFVLCDAIFIADKDFAEIAKKANVHGETYEDCKDVWERYGIDIEIIRVWIKDRKIGNRDWQRRVAKNAMTILKHWEELK